MHGDFRKSRLRPSAKFEVRIGLRRFAFGRYGTVSVSAVYLQQFPSYSNHN